LMGNTLVFAMTHVREWRRIFIGVGIAGLLVPITLEALRVVPRSYAFDGTSMRLISEVASFHELPTMTVLAIATVGALCTAAWLVGRMHDAAYDAEKRMHLQSWQLRQLVPREVLDGMGRAEDAKNATMCKVESLVDRITHT
jgi:hypothetical protein